MRDFCTESSHNLIMQVYGCTLETWHRIFNIRTRVCRILEVLPDISGVRACRNSMKLGSTTPAAKIFMRSRDTKRYHAKDTVPKRETSGQKA